MKILMQNELKNLKESFLKEYLVTQTLLIINNQ